MQKANNTVTWIINSCYKCQSIVYICSCPERKGNVSHLWCVSQYKRKKENTTHSVSPLSRVSLLFPFKLGSVSFVFFLKNKTLPVLLFMSFLHRIAQMNKCSSENLTYFLMQSKKGANCKAGYGEIQWYLVPAGSCVTKRRIKIKKSSEFMTWEADVGRCFQESAVGSNS